MWTRVLLAMLLLVFIGWAPAAETGEADFLTEEDMAAVGAETVLGEGQEKGDVGSSLIRMVASLALVAGLAVGLGWAVKRFGASRRLLPHSGGHLRVLETVPMGVKRSLSLIAVGDRVLVVGQAEQGFTALGDFAASMLESGEDDECQHVAGATTPAQAPSAPPTSATPSAPPPGEAAVAGFQDRLRALLQGKG